MIKTAPIVYLTELMRQSIYHEVDREIKINKIMIELHKLQSDIDKFRQRPELFYNKEKYSLDKNGVFQFGEWRITSSRLSRIAPKLSLFSRVKKLFKRNNKL